MIKSALDDLKLVAIIGLATYTHKQDHFSPTFWNKRHNYLLKTQTELIC